MIITKKHLPRRTFLKGMGVTVALPMLDAMTPALASPAEKVKSPLRLAFAYAPNGIEMKSWTPEGVGKDFEFTRILKPLEPFREDLLVLTDFAEHARLMNDLLVIAFQADITRISTLLYSREGSNRAYPALGFTDGHHPITHHRYIPDLVEKVTKINCHHMEQFARFIQKLKTIQEGDGLLLDHCMIVYGSSLSNGNTHSHVNLPVIILGRGAGALKSGRHVVYADQPPMTNLFLTLLDKMGVPTEKLGDSTGKIAHLADV